MYIKQEKLKFSATIEKEKVISLADYTPFVLDIAKIGDRSLSKNIVDLPYIGPLPESVANSATAYIRFLVRVPDTPYVALTVISADGCEGKYPVEASVDEIREVLDRFFWGDGCACEDWEDDECNECDEPCGRAVSDTGLDAYSAGMWIAHYVDWINVGGRICESSE